MSPWPQAPSELRARPAFDRYLGPFRQLPWHVPAWRLKHWLYLSVNAREHFLALGMVQLGYISQLFVYLVDKRDGSRRAFEQSSPLGRALQLSPSPSQGISRWRSRRARVDMQADSASGFRLDLDLPLSDSRLTGELHVPFGEGLSMLFDLGRARPAYSYKAADLTARCALQLAGRSLPLEDARACVDWTYSHARYRTHWHWASATGVTRDGTQLGLNLSQHVYDLAGVSQENVLWLDGEPQPVGRVVFQVPRDPRRDAWQLTSSDPAAELSLRFMPQGARVDAQQYGLISSHFTQASGHFEGNVLGREVKDLYGVMEDHRARW